MNNPCLSAIYLGGTLCFGVLTLAVLPALIRLLAALLSGSVKWPGPPIHDLDPNVSLGKLRLGLPSDHLFPTFIRYALVLVGTFVFSLLTFLSGTPLLAGYVQVRCTWGLLILALVLYLGGLLSARKAFYHTAQVQRLLSDLAGNVEPRNVDGLSAEAEYAIEHPLLERKAPGSVNPKALRLFCESVRCYQDGREGRALQLYQEALDIDPSLHEHARETLMDMEQGCSLKNAGALYYWLGIHSEHLHNWKEAETWYAEAIQALSFMGHKKRESRAHCNLGSVKMRLRDPSAMGEFETAIALNPRNGTAHLNIGRIYYGIAGPEDDRYERALDAFADAILADPAMYGPKVISILREIGYTWREDLDKITQRAESKRGSP
jgi:tetratricopeptide (TPR) repeat protein